MREGPSSLPSQPTDPSAAPPEAAQQRAYWHNQLQDWTPTIDLPAAAPNTAPAIIRRTFAVPAALLNATSSTDLILAVFQIALFRYSRQRDLVVGLRYNGGYLPIRTVIAENETFGTLYGRVCATFDTAREHADLPAAAMAELLRSADRDPAAPALPASLAFQPEGVSAAELTGRALEADLELHLITAGDNIHGLLRFNAATFDEAVIGRFGDHFLNLLASAVARPDLPVARLPILAAAEQRTILRLWNDTSAPITAGACVHDLIERQVDRTPDAVAVSDGAEQLTYAELDRRANQLAHHLIRLGVGPEALVGLCLERSIELIVGLLAILKAGGAYVPLDPAYPAERISLMLADSAPLVVITRRSQATALGPAARLLLLDQSADLLAAAPDHRPQRAQHPSSLAYLIYTSGSTGQPKGVMVEHRSLANFIEQAIEHYDMSAADRVLQCSSISWDTSAEEIYPCLASGGTLLLRTPHMLDSARAFLDQCREWRLSVLNLATAFWHELMIDAARAEINTLDTVRLVIIGGERANHERVALWRELIDPRIRLMNTYGATEATAITATWDLTAPGQPPLGPEVPIGRPFPNVQTYILDDQGQPVPPGVLGDLYIGGHGLARGYRNDPALTASKFVPSHLEDARPGRVPAGGRLYRTGDIARYRPDGAIEYFGRMDHQVKIRGHRIALGEIEDALGQHPAAREVVVLAREDQPGRQRLVAYVVPQPGAAPEVGELREFLSARLPAYMLPAAFVLLPALPLTPNGKINRRALPAPGLAGAERAAAQHTRTEAQLAAIWAELLGAHRFVPGDNFFELGGHSLLVIHLIARVRETFGFELSLQAILAYPTLGDLAGLIDGSLSAVLPAETTDWEAEAVLDPQIGFAGPPAATEPAAILLTGATGFLGAFLLNELLHQTGATIHCLVRASTPAAAAARIRASLEEYELWDEALVERIVPLPGDLAQPDLGLDGAAWAELAGRIDWIYHNGAAVNFVYPYAALKAANVGGTAAILRLAGQGRVKPLDFISTLAVAEAASAGAAEVAEDTGLPLLDSHSGYVQSKWVAERLVMQAQARGLPARIYRPDRIAGHSVSGASNNDDFFFRLLAGCVAMRAAPDLALDERMLPVDYVSRAIVRLSRLPDQAGRAFHLFHRHPLAFGAALASVRAAGHPLELLPYAEWRRRLLDTATPEHPLYPFIELFPAAPAELDGLGYQTAVPVADRATQAALSAAGLHCPPIDAAMIRAYLEFFLRRKGSP
jgi:amino acid adenylation domain-containing protein/thioester reductase-like protein